MVLHHRTPSHDRLLLEQPKGDIEQQQLLLQIQPTLTPPLPPMPPVPTQKRFQSQEPEPAPKLPHRRFYPLLAILGLVSLSLVLASLFLLYGAETRVAIPCSDVPNNTICCDRTTSISTDVCVMRGDIRTRPSASSIFLYNADVVHPLNKDTHGSSRRVEKIRPYTRKWETSVMDTINQLDLVATTDNPVPSISHKCDVNHDVPAVVFSTGGYTSNVYHGFNYGLLPLYITANRFNKKVVFVALEYHAWWVTKYADVLAQMSEYPVLDFFADNRTHCFPEVTVGLRIHDKLTIDSEQMRGADHHNNKDNHQTTTILDFRKMLDNAYRPRIRHLEQEEQLAAAASNKTQPAAADVVDDQAPEPTIIERPKLVIISRTGSRGIDNENDLVSLCEEIGFSVHVLRPDRTTELAKIYRDLNDSDAMIGVHGAAMTHLLFMRPGSVFIQIVPLGSDWAAENYYGAPARKMGLKYVAYRILPKESSLYNKYPRDDLVLRDTIAVAATGWQVTEEVYLDGQNVRLDLNRFLKRLPRAYRYTSTKRNKLDVTWNWSWQLPPQSLSKDTTTNLRCLASHFCTHYRIQIFATSVFLSFFHPSYTNIHVHVILSFFHNFEYLHYY